MSTSPKEPVAVLFLMLLIDPLVRAYCETPEMTLRTAEFRLAITLLGGQLWILQRVGGEAGDIIGVACLELPGKDQAIE